MLLDKIKKFNFHSLRVRITLIVSLIIFLVTILLSFISIKNANNGFNKILFPNDENFSFFIAEEYIPFNDYDSFQFATDNSNQLNIYVQNILDISKGNFTFSTIIWMIIITILSAVFTWFIMGHALKKIPELNTEIKNINDRNFKISVDNYKDNNEILELAISFQDMLSRLENSFIIQKNFASGAAHELKTPLTIMKSSLQILNLDENISIEDYKENSDLMYKNTERLINLVDDLMNFTIKSEIETIDKIDLPLLIDDILDELDNEVIKRDLNITKSLDSILFKGNYNLIYRAIFNIISNAVKYNILNGNIDINISLSLDNIDIIISDTGVGISKEDLPHIFDMFFRGEKSRSRQYGGSGLGLSISKNIIEFHNGKIEVDSNSLGSTFKIILPKNL